MFQSMITGRSISTSSFVNCVSMKVVNAIDGLSSVLSCLSPGGFSAHMWIIILQDWLDNSVKYGV